jgi:hypothetical protein
MRDVMTDLLVFVDIRLLYAADPPCLMVKAATSAPSDQAWNYGSAK